MKIEPERIVPPSRRKPRSSIAAERLESQRSVLSRQLEDLYSRREDLPRFSGRVLIVTQMFDDSFAKSWTPDDLFARASGAQLVLPIKRGYLLEVQITALPELSRIAQTDTTVARMVDISRIESVYAYGETDVLRGRDLDTLWNQAPEFQKGKGFIFAPAPYRDRHAQENVIDRLLQYAREEVILPTVRLQISGATENPVAVPVSAADQSSLAVGLRNYRNTGRSRFVLQVPSKENLAELLSSGTAFRIDPVVPINVTVSGVGTHPVSPLPPNLAEMPIVGVVDGGLQNRTCKAAEAWREVPLFPGRNGAWEHGDQVSAPTVQAHA